MYKTLGTHGRFGNAMFQYAALKALSIKLGCEMKIPNLENCHHHGQKCNLIHFNLENYSFIKGNESIIDFNEKNGLYDPEYFNCKENTNLFGHYESELYFENVKDIIKNEYQLKDNIKNICENYINNIKIQYSDHTIIALHIRLGDYLTVDNSPYTTNEWLANYIQKAIKYFDDIDKKIFLVFSGGARWCDDNRNDINYCKQLIQGNNILFCEGFDSIHDFGIMTMCDHLITTSTSTFGWWSGYLNKNINKRIIVPIPYENDIKKPDIFWSKSFIQI